MSTIVGILTIICITLCVTAGVTVREHDQEIPQSSTAGQSTAP